MKRQDFVHPQYERLCAVFQHGWRPLPHASARARESGVAKNFLATQGLFHSISGQINPWTGFPNPGSSLCLEGCCSEENRLQPSCHPARVCYVVKDVWHKGLFLGKNQAVRDKSNISVIFRQWRGGDVGTGHRRWLEYQYLVVWACWLSTGSAGASPCPTASQHLSGTSRTRCTSISLIQIDQS